MLSEGSSVKGSLEDKQPSGPYIKGSAKISRRVTLALYTGITKSSAIMFNTKLATILMKYKIFILFVQWKSPLSLWKYLINNVHQFILQEEH